MRRLILLRHAKSDWKGAIPDQERPLADRGIHTAPMIGAYMAQAGLSPDLVLCSPALRTRQTWDLVSPHLARAEVRFEARLYEANADAVVQVIREAPGDPQTLLVVGHNPGLEDAAESLIGTAAEIAHAALRFKFPTAALAVLDFDIQAWRQLAIRTGRLADFTTPDMLEERSA